MIEPPPLPPEPSTNARHAAPTVAFDWRAARGEKWRAQLSGMEAMLAPVDDPLIRALRLGAPCRVADLGCGGGGTALETLRRAPGGSVVHGFDLSPALVDVARERARLAGGLVAFDVADVATTRPAQPYTRLLSRFGVMFFDAPPAAFANLFRWLEPGGRFAFAVWGRLPDNPWMSIVRDAVADVVDLPPPEPDAPGPFRYAAAENLLALLERAGFDELDSSAWRGALPLGGGLPASDAARFALASFSSFGELLAKAGDDAVVKAHQTLTARFLQREQNGSVQIDACVHIVTGARPV